MPAAVGSDGVAGPPLVAGDRTAKRRASPYAMAIAAVCYLAVEVWIWRDVVLHPATAAVGSNPSSDYQLMTWSLDWWPWAVAHGVDPLFTNMVWAPHSSPTTWMTSIPAVALVAAPVTTLAGPLVSYNVLMLLAPFLAALCAFHLCRSLTGSIGASLVGGYVFGFSPYVLGHALSQHLDLVMVWPLPLLVLAAVRYVRGEIGQRGFVLRVGPLLVFLLGSALELLATSVVLGAIVWAAAFAGAPALRRRLIGLARGVAVAGVVVLAVAAPFAWLTLATRHPPLPFAPERYATDAANLIVPTTQTVGGASAHALALSRRFVGNVGEQDGYLGLPLLIVCVLATVRPHGRRTWIAATGLIVALTWSLGPTLVVAGRTVAAIPLTLSRAPVLDMALPARVACFGALAAAILAAEWLAGRRQVALRIVAGLLIIGSLLPGVAPLARKGVALGSPKHGRPPFGWVTATVPRAFLTVASHLPTGATVLVLPGGTRSAIGFWQAASGMRFRLADGFTPIEPPALVDDPIMSVIDTDTPPPLAIDRLRAFIVRTHVDAIAMLPSTSPAWRSVVLAATRTQPTTIRGIRVVTVDPSAVARLAASPVPVEEAARGSTALSTPGLDAAGVVATSDDGHTAAAWLQFDPATLMAEVAASGLGTSSTWTAPAVLSDPAWEASEPQLAVGPGSTAAAVWIEARNGNVRLEIARSRSDGTWTQLPAPPLEDVPSAPAVAVGPSGQVLAAWAEQRGPRTVVRAARWDASGAMAGPFTLSSADVDAGPPVVDASATPTVAWQESDATAGRIVVARLGAGGAAQASALDQSDAYSVPMGRPVAAGSAVAWVHGRGELRASVGGRIQVLDRVPVAAPSDGIAQPAVDAAARGTIIAWQRTSDRRTTTRAVQLSGSGLRPVQLAALPPGAIETPGAVTILDNGEIASSVLMPGRGRVIVLRDGRTSTVIPPRGLLLRVGDRVVRLAAVGPAGGHRIVERPIGPQPIPTPRGGSASAL